MPSKQLLLLVMFVLAAGACGDTAGTTVDCAVACDHRLAICAEGCSYASCTRSLSQEGCLQECDQTLDVSSMDLLFRCLTAHDTCEAMRESAGIETTVCAETSLDEGAEAVAISTTGWRTES